ncbi:hypothetical protein HOO65_070439 [Ceratocystis lukuohia]|uniref:Uncharacterized protein n=1 Tax=Ceratocystis lukuohia TaxID=2019550 RepID=A0ABR4MCJ1_9PEZI
MAQLLLCIAIFFTALIRAASIDNDASAVIGIYSTGTTGENAQYTTWDGTVGCRWLSLPASDQLTTTSISRGLSCAALALPHPQALSTPAPMPSAAIMSFAEGDSVRLFASMTTRTVTCGGAGCGTLRVWDFDDGPTPVAGELGVLVTCLDDLALPPEAQNGVLYRNVQLATSMFSTLPAPSNSANASIASLSPESSESPTHTPHRISSGAIAGIAVGAIASLGLLITLLFFVRRICRRRHSSRPHSNSTIPGPQSSSPMPNAVQSGEKTPADYLSLTGAASELDSPKVSWALWRRVRATDVPQELPPNSRQAELPASVAMPLELDDTSYSLTMSSAVPGALERRAQERERSRREEQAGETADNTPVHPYDFYSPWDRSLGLQAERDGE